MIRRGRKSASNATLVEPLGSLTIHLPFAQRGVPVLDVIDAHYGPSTDATPDGYHHTAQDTLDKISAHSLQISGDILLELIRLINQRP